MSLTTSIAAGAAELGVTLPSDAPVRLAKLIETILRFNQRVNLVGPCTADEAVERHVLDSLALLRLVDEVASVVPGVDATRWLDVGSGGGFPGLVLALARPALRVTVVEPIGKKLALIKQAARLHGVPIAALQARLEELDPTTLPRCAVSRATFAPGDWLARADQVLGPDAAVIVMMGPEPDPEVVRRAVRVDSLALPQSGSTRTNALVVTGTSHNH